MPVEEFVPTSVSDYREELMRSLSLARESALENIKRSQQRYKTQYDRKVNEHHYQVGDWILIRFPSDETGKQRKLSRPWHGLYRVTAQSETNLTAVKVYSPLEGSLRVHQSRAKPCPEGFLA